jgi:glycerol-3-phosphate dehydrogenase
VGIPIERGYQDPIVTGYHPLVLAFSGGTRREALQRMAEGEVDLLVIGGGITGCGVALDAASRGFSVALVERDDFASGTSGRSSRLIHGGVRYLEHYEFRVIRECLRERAILLRLAPHLASPTPLYVPTRGLRQKALFRLGLLVYDALAMGLNVGRNGLATADEIRRASPGLAKPSAGVTYTECRADDARLTLEVARTAVRFGAMVANHAVVRGLDVNGRVRGARVADRLTGESFDVRARLTVNAAGVWADHVQSLATEAPRLLRPSKGIHLVFRPGSVRTRTGLLAPTLSGDDRFVYVIPWGDRVYAGTTDTAYDGDQDDPPVDEADFDYVFAPVAAAFPEVTREDVVAWWAGLRPLLAQGSGHTRDLSRRHAIYENPPGLLTVTGGKLTTFRAMAEDVVDRAAGVLGRGGTCRTRSLPLGFTGRLPEALDRAAREASSGGVDPEAGRRMVRRFGDDWTEAMALIKQDRSLAEPAVDGLPVLKVELELARSREMAMTDEDVLIRRTRLTTLDRKAAAALPGSGSLPGPARP